VIVVDTNIIAYLFVTNEEFTPLADQVYGQDPDWIAPSLWNYEFFNLLNLYRKRSMLGEDEMKSLYFKALETIEAVDLVDLSFIYNVAVNSDLTGYDAFFVALASEKNLPLVTEDKKILNGFPTVAISMKGFLKK
jgi:predicted nucleic acid-binding protein